MITQESEKSYSEESQSYSFKYACVVNVPIILKVPLAVKPTVIANKPICRQNDHYDKQYEEQIVEAN